MKIDGKTRSKEKSAMPGPSKIPVGRLFVVMLDK